MSCVYLYSSSLYAPDNGQSDVKHVVRFRQNIVFLTDHLLFLAISGTQEDELH